MFSTSSAVRPAAAQQAGVPADSIVESYRGVANRIIAAAMRDDEPYRRTTFLADHFGPRLSGSANLEQAIDWILTQLQADGFQHVRGKPVRVPHWVRGAESAMLDRPWRQPLTVLGLGGTVPTPAQGITGDVLVVNNFDELRAKGTTVRGKIVVFDVPFTTYGATARYRVTGATQAARLGAVAALVRSVTPYSLDTPHTGSVVYDTTAAPPIPAAAVTVEEAMILHRLQDSGEHPTPTLHLDDHILADAPSRNIIAELPGGAQPGDIVVIGAHVDSRDVGQGAI